MGESLITDEMRAQIGVDLSPVRHEITRTSVRMFARAVGHVDPVYYDVEAAQRAGYRDLPCPPGYLGTVAFDPRDSRDPREAVARLKTTLARGLNGGTEFEYFDTPCAGDVLISTSRLTEVEGKQGSLGPMIVTRNETTYRYEDGRTVAVFRGTGIQY
jgi:hypothetical protein